MGAMPSWNFICGVQCPHGHHAPYATMITDHYRNKICHKRLGKVINLIFPQVPKLPYNCYKSIHFKNFNLFYSSI